MNIIKVSRVKYWGGPGPSGPPGSYAYERYVSDGVVNASELAYFIMTLQLHTQQMASIHAMHIQKNTMNWSDLKTTFP